MNDEVTRLGLSDDADIVLDEAALTLAALDHPGIALAPYREQLADMAARLSQLRDHARSAFDQAALLAGIIAGDCGFSGDADTYDDPANADLIAVLDRRRGMPIALSILYVGLARRVGWSAVGLNIPGHLLVRVGEFPAGVVIDPFNGGGVVQQRAVAELLARAGAPADAPERVPALSNQAMLVRLLINQATRARQANDDERALTLYQRMTAVAPTFTPLWWDRAALEQQLGQISAARNSLQAMLETTRDESVHSRVRAALDKLARSIN